MSRQETHSGGPERPRGSWIVNWKTRLSLAGVTVVVLSACVGLRLMWGNTDASAQAPVRGPITTPAAAPANSAPAAKPAGQSPAGQAPGAQADPSQLKVLAVVNGQEVSRQQLAQEALRRYGEEVLESLVNKFLIVEACRQRQINITEQDVDQEIVRMAGKFGLSAERWITMLRDERKIDPQQYRRDIVWPTLALRRLAADKIEITRAELDEVLESEFGPKVQVAMIASNSLEKARQLHAAAVANPDPESFGALAKDHSQDSFSAANRGVIPPIGRHTSEPQIEQVVFSLRQGEISDVVQAAGQYLVFQCLRHIPATSIDAQTRAVAEQRIADRIRDSKLRNASAELFKQLQEQTRVQNVYNDVELRSRMPGVAALAGETQITVRQLAEECLARHGEEVLEGEINRMLLQQELTRKNIRVEEADIDAEVARAAEAYGVVHPDGSPNVEAWLERVKESDGVTVDLYIRDAVWPSVALKKLCEGEVRVDQNDLQKGFEANFGPRVEVQAIVLSSLREAQEVFKLARANNNEQFFGQLAEQYSIEPASRHAAGHVPPIRRHSGQPLLEEEAFKLQPGELSSIIAVGEQSVILRCLGRTQPVVQKFEEVKEELHRDIYEKKLRLKMSEYFDNLRESSQIDNFLAGTSQSGRRASAAGGAPANAAGRPGIIRR